MACRSCHAPAQDPVSPEFVPDCGACHGPYQEPPSLAALAPTKAVALELVLPDGFSAEERAAWTSELAERLVEEGLEILEPGALGASPLSITIEAQEGPGATDAGIDYHAVRYSATLEVHRARTTLPGRPGVAVDAAAARKRARDDLLGRIALALTPGL